ncbi:hypothetical protein TWF102_005708 [Orbilia oligospora]|uniref:F-box domain-containing protein n=1 Tax=Orbilia oligospora TaxID=2813651 RepID=A0A7C8JD21_ORBOL|nr:hypothetical protein TWF102_005708 [Orbilia oligospora]KAF3114636.1 hypothetical protein TWF103_001093 [Orbilia oligospora]
MNSRTPKSLQVDYQLYCIYSLAGTSNPLRHLSREKKSSESEPTGPSMPSVTEYRPSLSTLPTELLIQICEILFDSKSNTRNTTQATRTSKPPILDGLSRTCSRFREICRPYVFQNLIVDLKEDFDLLSLKSLSADKGILSYVGSLRIHSAIKPSLRRPADTIFGPNAPPEVVFSFIRRIMRRIPRLRSLSITINDIELNDIFANPRWHTPIDIDCEEEEEINLVYLEELTVSENSTWVIALGDNQPQIPFIEEDEEGEITKTAVAVAETTGLRKLSFVHPGDFGAPELNGSKLWEYRGRTEGFVMDIMALGLESGLANGIRELKIQRTLDVVDLQKLAAVFPELEVFEYWIDRPLNPSLHSLGSGSRLVFHSLFMHLSLGIAPLTPPYNHDVFTDIRLLGKYCRNLRQVRVQGVVRANIKWLPQMSAARYQVMFWEEEDGTTVAEVPCYRVEI